MVLRIRCALCNIFSEISIYVLVNYKLSVVLTLFASVSTYSTQLVTIVIEKNQDTTQSDEISTKGLNYRNFSTRVDRTLHNVNLISETLWTLMSLAKLRLV